MISMARSQFERVVDRGFHAVSASRSNAPAASTASRSGRSWRLPGAKGLRVARQILGNRERPAEDLMNGVLALELTTSIVVSTTGLLAGSEPFSIATRTYNR
jgi:hypothetical protein